jgi:hypothetical protein
MGRLKESSMPPPLLQSVSKENPRSRSIRGRIRRKRGAQLNALPLYARRRETPTPLAFSF